MSRTEPPCTSAHPPGTAKHKQAELLTVHEKREALIAPLTAKLQAYGQRARSGSRLMKSTYCDS